MSELNGLRILVTGIADEHSLALHVARGLASRGAELVCAGLGPTPHHRDLSEPGRRLAEAKERFESTVRQALGAQTPTIVLDASLDGSLDDAGRALQEAGLAVDGVLHAIAMDRTIRRGTSVPLLEVSREDFLGCMDVSAYSLVAITRMLVSRDLLRDGGSIVALSYLGAERVMSHAYRNIGVAKAALERAARELAHELGERGSVRVNAVRFSPYSASRAGGAIPDLEEAIARAAEVAPLGNATPDALALEICHLMSPGLQVTGEIRHVDGGYHAAG